MIDTNNVFAELTPDAANRLREQSRLTTPERILRLIDHFATTEAKIKWAPNKGLHLEIAVIKAMQILGETTLSDVIGLLHQTGSATGMDMETAPATESKRPAASSSASPAARKAAPKEVAPAPDDDDAIDLSPSGGSAEAAKSPASEAPTTRPRPKGPLSGAALWAGVIEVISAERPLNAGWARAGAFGEQSDKRLLVYFSPSDRFARDSMMRENVKTFIEDCLKELAGKPLTFAAEVKEGMAAAPIPDFDDDEPPAASAAAPAPVADSAKTKNAPAKKNDPAEPTVAPEPPAPEEVKAAAPVDPQTFMNDPLIQGALDLFEAEIESSN